MEMRVLRIKDLELPLPNQTEDPKLLELRMRFERGDRLGQEELEQLARAGSGRLANDNCWAC